MKTADRIMKGCVIFLGLLTALITITSCKKPSDEKLEPTPFADVLEFFEKQQKSVLTFAGYSGAEFEHPDELIKTVTDILSERDQKTTLINIGVTPDGIGIVYQWARELGFETTGVVSSKALEYESSASEYVDHPFFTKDSQWCGYIAGTEKLSPTSEAMVTISDEMIAIGGGNVTRDELQEMRRLGKPIRFIKAEMNNARAIAKAKKNGLPEPTNFDGAAHSEFASKPVE